MNRDNFLYLFCGAVLGLIAGTIFLGPLVADARRGPAQQAAVAARPSAESAVQSTPEMAVMQRVMADIENLKKRLSENPSDVEAMVGLGNLYMDAHKFEDAIGFFERALAISPNADVETDLGLCYRGQGDVDKALATFRRVRSQHPGHFAARYNEAVVLFVDLKRAEEARAIIDQLAQERPGDPSVEKFQQALTATASGA